MDMEYLKIIFGKRSIKLAGPTSVLIILFILSACNPKAATAQTRVSVITAAPDSTATATPFQPVLVESPTAEVMETPTAIIDAPIWGDYPAPQVFPYYLGIPSPAEIITQPKGQTNILLLGSDQRPNDGGFRTDTMILITLSPAGEISLTSFPRDLYVYIPGWMMQRLNTAYGFGGFNTLGMTFEYNFGVKPDYFVLINFNGFRSIMNSLGGVTVNVGITFTDARDGYYPGGYTVYPGPVYMDAETALWYVRSRYSSSDIDRLRRAQEVLQAIGLKLFSLDGLNRVPELFDTYKANVVTNLNVETCLRFLPALNLLSDPTGVRRYVIGYDQAYDWVEPSSGAQVLLPVPEAIHEVLLQALNVP
jgi:polyisoprenyl-teichoic acid--peptidoglycan teichoic acid transferase